MSSFFNLIWSWIKGAFEWIARKLKGEDDLPIEPIEPTDSPTRKDDPSEIICYYGCPNSKKAQKLQLSRKLYR